MAALSVRSAFSIWIRQARILCPGCMAPIGADSMRSCHSTKDGACVSSYTSLYSMIEVGSGAWVCRVRLKISSAMLLASSFCPSVRPPSRRLFTLNSESSEAVRFLLAVKFRSNLKHGSHMLGEFVGFHSHLQQPKDCMTKHIVGVRPRVRCNCRLV